MLKIPVFLPVTREFGAETGSPRTVSSSGEFANDPYLSRPRRPRTSCNRPRQRVQRLLMMTGSPDRIIEFDGDGQPYLSKPFPPDVFLKCVQEMLAAG